MSTGVNPHHYRLFNPSANALTRLPEVSDVLRLQSIAASAYGAPSAAHVVAAPGTQILLPRVAALVAPGRARVLGPTYAEHARALGLAGHAVEEVSAFEDLFDADIAVVVNPNNPDGRIVPRQNLRRLALALGQRRGLLVVDEAFMDVGPQEQAVDGDCADLSIVVLRSFGKFFGLAGLRLGFALAPMEIAQKLRFDLGPWAISGPALEYGARALADRQWQAEMRQRLCEDAAALDALLLQYGFEILGGTSLYRYLLTKQAPQLFSHLGRRGVWTRRFDAQPRALRMGLPADPPAFARLEQALLSFAREAGG